MKYGYSVCIIWEYELLDIDAVRSKLLKFDSEKGDDVTVNKKLALITGITGQ